SYLSFLSVAGAYPAIDCQLRSLFLFLVDTTLLVSFFLLHLLAPLVRTCRLPLPWLLIAVNDFFARPFLYQPANIPSGDLIFHLLFPCHLSCFLLPDKPLPYVSMQY